MVQYSTLFRPLFWIGMGMTYALIIAGARVWAQDLGLNMTWWKWMLSATWYGLVSLSVASSFTLIGEKEPKAGTCFLGVSLAVTVVLGVGLWLVLTLV